MLTNRTGSEKRCSIFGGLFGLDTATYPECESPSFLTDRDILLVNARSGIYLLVTQIRPTTVWLPSYLCHTIVSAIDLSISKVRYYEINYDLTIASDYWIREVSEGDLVIFIDYFGFPYDHNIGVLIKEKGAFVLEDASQALLSKHVGLYSDFVLFSPRKWIGVPDGGILRVPDNSSFSSLLNITLQKSEPMWWFKAFNASLLRREFDDGLTTREWFNLYREAESTAPTGNYAMSELSCNILSFAINYSLIAQKRIDNYRVLLEELEEYSIFTNMGRDTVPLGFPVRIENRDVVRQALFDNEIYPPVHWSIDGVVPDKFLDSHRLARNIMTIPCDQRYDISDIERIREIFLKYAMGNSR